jgi:hypothetical protein
MSKTSLAIGLTVSLFVHGALLLPGQRTAAVPAVCEEPDTAPTVTRLTIETPQAIEQPPLPEPKPLEEPPPKPPAEPVIEQLQEVVDIPDTHEMEGPGDYVEAESTDDGLPELRLAWDSPEQLIDVARALGLRILTVDGTGQPVGELAFGDDVAIKDFKGGLSSFSNRVRAIPARFFGPELLRQSNRSFTCFWVLVPVSVDTSWIAAQKEAIRAKGLKSDEVSRVEAKVVSSDSNYKLVVTQVVTL